MSTEAISILVSALTAGLVSLWVNWMQDWFRVRHISKKLQLEPQARVGTRATARVVNNSNYVIRQAAAYVTIQHDLDDVLAPPMHFAAFIEGNHLKTLDEDRLCWSAVAPARNPPAIDIYAGEKQLLDVANFGGSGDWIEIPSETGYASSQTQAEAEAYNTARIRSRVFLRAGRRYQGTIKIVSADTLARVFHVEIDPTDRTQPLSLITSKG
jgi:hypothetical protein